MHNHTATTCHADLTYTGRCVPLMVKSAVASMLPHMGGPVRHDPLEAVSSVLEGCHFGQELPDSGGCAAG